MKLNSFFKGLRLHQWSFFLFSFFWIAFIIVDYLNKHPVYWISFVHFKYFTLLLFWVVTAVLSAFYYKSIGPFKQIKSPFLNGLIIIFVFFIIILSITLAFNTYWKAPLTSKNYFHILSKASYTIGGSYFFLLASFSIGQFIRNKFLPRKKITLTFTCIDMSIGFFLISISLFILGLFQMLTQIATLGLLAAFVLLNYRVAWKFTRRIFWEKIHIADSISFWGILISFAVIAYLTLNFIYTQAPFPLGFDARNYYVNISKLIADDGSLIPGFQPYAWSLIMSLGYIAFNSPEITLFLSSLGGILCVFTVFDLGVNYLKVNPNFAIGAFLLFISTPSVTNQSIVEFKIDLPLLFVQMSLLNFTLFWLFKYKQKKSNPVLLSTKKDYFFLVILSAIMGFTLSIKVLSVFIIIGILQVLWLHSKDVIGVLGFTSAFMGSILLFGLDEISGLRSYHLNAEFTGWSLVGLGAILLVWTLIINKIRFYKNVKMLVITGFLMVFFFSPWIVKNYVYTRSTSLMPLIIGDKPRPDLDPNTLDKNYQEYLKQQNQVGND